MIDKLMQTVATTLGHLTEFRVNPYERSEDNQREKEEKE